MWQTQSTKLKHRFTQYFILIFSVVIVSCNQQNQEVKQMQLKIDNMQKQLSQTYTPGLGEFMSGIQLHHAKLWFAGQYQNWALADFEVHEIKEALNDIQQFCRERTEVKAIGMINPAIDSVNNSVRLKNLSAFDNSFYFLTNTCNKCHRATNHSFNVVIVPNNLPVVNQDFKSSQLTLK